MIDIALFSLNSTGGVYFLLKWFHLIFSIIWIGLLYYVNLIQEPMISQVSQPFKTIITQHILSRILFWFRWSSLVTVLTGYLMILLEFAHGRSHHDPWTIKISAGAAMGTLMWFNVWFIIYPTQKRIIDAANNPRYMPNPSQTRRSFLASRTNTLLSIPLLFFMGAARNLPIEPSLAWLLIIFVILTLIQINALKDFFTSQLEKVKKVFISSFILTFIFYILAEVFRKSYE